MKYDMTFKQKYSAPRVEEVELRMGSFTMASGLEDYDDNPIFGSPALGGPESMDIFGL